MLFGSRFLNIEPDSQASTYNTICINDNNLTKIFQLNCLYAKYFSPNVGGVVGLHDEELYYSEWENVLAVQWNEKGRRCKSTLYNNYFSISFYFKWKSRTFRVPGGSCLDAGQHGANPGHVGGIRGRWQPIPPANPLFHLSSRPVGPTLGLRPWDFLPPRGDA